MKIKELSESRAYFEISSHILHQNRLEFVKIFFGLLAALPFSLFCKLWHTSMKGVSVLASGFFLLLTFGISRGMRELFVSRVSSFAANLADWVLFPFAVMACLSRLLLGSVIHPSLFIRY